MDMDKKRDTGTNATGYNESLLYAYRHSFSFATEGFADRLAGVSQSWCIT